jgi:hypothetical protein
MSTPADKSASLSDLRRDVVVRDNSPPVVMGFGDAAGFELMQRGAKLLASSSLVPKDYQNNVANCCIALNMAARLGADPLLIMQNLYLVSGRPGWSAQFLVATFNACKRFASIRYQWSGTEGKDDWSCRAHSKELGTGDIITGPLISIALAKKEGWYQKSGSKWQTIPELMLMYRAAAWMIRTHAPELSMGLQTVEELGDTFDARLDDRGRYSVNTEDLRRAGELPTTQPDPPGLIDDCKKALNEAGDLAGLDGAWSDIGSLYAGRDAPVDLEALYKFKREGFTGKAP